MKTHIIKISLMCFMGANLLAVVILVHHWKEIRPCALNVVRPYLYDYSEGDAACLRRILKHVRAQEFGNQTALIDYIRNFVYSNSYHYDDDISVNKAHGMIEKLTLDQRRNVPLVLRKICGYYWSAGNLPGLCCSSRAQAMREIVVSLGIQSRLVHVYSSDYDEVMSHTFLEILNEDTGEWEVHDPDYNIYYIDKRSGQRLPVSRLILVGLQGVVPCNSDSNCGYTKTKAMLLKDHYLGAAMYDFRMDGVAPVVIVNTDRFSLSKVFSKNGSIEFIQFVRQYYGEPSIVSYRTMNLAGR